MNNLISMHSYWLLNTAIAFSYIVTIFISKPFNKNISQAQQLLFSRKVFTFVIVIFLLTPFVLAKLPLKQHDFFQFQPVLKHASTHLLSKQIKLNTEITALPSIFFRPTLNMLLMLIILFGITVFIIKYMIDLLNLSRLTQQAFRLRQIKNITISLSENVSIPFCWSSFTSHYVVIPITFIEKPADFKLAIKHELQHIRQGDTYWLHIISILKMVCFWNPFVKAWQHTFHDLQEFACDEAIILNKHTSRINYAQCLIDAAATAHDEKQIPQIALGIFKFSKNYHSILNRRITMMFVYKKLRKTKIALASAYAICLISAGSFAYALNNNAAQAPLNKTELINLIQKSHLNVVSTPEVLTEINNIRSSEQARAYMLASLERMQQYQPYIETQLKKQAMPTLLLALPLVESGYNVNAKSAMQATGIWQFIPETATHFNLTINSNRDDRLDTKLATQAALTYLNMLYTQFHDWKLAVIAYEIGEDNTEKLIKQVSSRDPWKLARSSYAPHELNKFLAAYDAALIIINNPELIKS